MNFTVIRNLELQSVLKYNKIVQLWHYDVIPKCYIFKIFVFKRIHSVNNFALLRQIFCFQIFLVSSLLSFNLKHWCVKSNTLLVIMWNVFCVAELFLKYTIVIQKVFCDVYCREYVKPDCNIILFVKVYISRLPYVFI